jgi:cobalt/nickel transport system permease protein
LHIHLADQYHPGAGWLHRLDPRVKVIICLGFILTANGLPPGSWLSLACLFLIALGAAWSSGMGATFALRRSLIALPFALAALTLPFTTPGERLLEWPALGLAVSRPGLIRAASLLLRAWLAVQAAALLLGTTRFRELLWALEAVRVPAVIVSLLGLTYRYLFLLADEALHMLRARRARSPGGHGPGMRWQARAAGGMVGALFLRALERSQRVHAAMLSRGYDGRARILQKRQLVRADTLALTLAFAGYGGLIAAALTAA